MAKNQDQRIMILKYLKEIVFVDGKKEGDYNNDGGDDENREAIIKLAQDSIKELGKN